jgi:hypothetical protein
MNRMKRCDRGQSRDSGLAPSSRNGSRPPLGVFRRGSSFQSWKRRWIATRQEVCVDLPEAPGRVTSGRASASNVLDGGSPTSNAIT